MAECGNMPDWHPYNPQQAGRSSAPTGGQSASAGHMFVPGMSPPTLDGMNLAPEGRHQPSKHQPDSSSFGSRGYQPGGAIAAPNCPTSSSLTSGVHMQPLASCVSHYGATTTRNAMMESLNTSMDPRMVPVSGITDEVSHRNSQMTFPGPTSHPATSAINVNSATSIHAASMPAQNSPVGSMSPSRQGAAFTACKAPCCNPDASIPYQHWDKFAAHHYHHGAPSAPAYRENIRQSGYAQLDNRRFLPEMNLRKDCMDGKDLEGPAPFPLDHRRNYPDYKYRKDGGSMPRNYPTNGANMLPSYPMQGYNFPTNEYQKCPYTVKDYMRRGGGGGATMNPKNPGILKYQEQQNALAQQKYQHTKQMQYTNGAVMPSAASSTLQNSYYNAAPMPRDYSREYQQQEQQQQQQQQQQQNATSARIAQPSGSHVHGYQKYHQVYHQKIAMQRYSVENHLRAYSRIPGYQSHPKYQECFMRYRELLKLQQTIDYPGAMQESPKIPSPANPAVAPINLQFDQNGMLINSSYIQAGYSGHHGQMNSTSVESADPAAGGRIAGPTNLETANQFVDHGENSMSLTRDLESQLRQNAAATMHENSERFFMSGEKNPQGRYENDGGRRNNETLGSMSSEESAKNGEQRAANSANSAAPQTNEAAAADYKNSKDFADKPELDVRQFLANWDESEDEDNAATVGLSDSAAEQFEEAVFAVKSAENSSQPGNSNEKTEDRENKEETPVSGNAEGENVENTATAAPIATEDSTESAGGENETMVKEIQCIRTDDGSDDIPTIHIVDSLEGGSEIEKIHTVFGSLASAVLNPISIAEGATETVAEGETIVLFEGNDGVCAKTVEFSVSAEATNSEVVEGVIASIIDSSAPETTTAVEAAKISDYKSPKSRENGGEDRLMERTAAVESSRSTGSSYSTGNSATSSSDSAKSNAEEATSLPKQNSFTSDESHNPDDISLPDLQTSECTPISTTLNTPIHSDSEESSEHVSDLTISTNPIEIIQNSPIISFTHSPIKIEPYEQLNDARMDRQQRRKDHDSLDFDFDREVARRENEKYNETTSVGFTTLETTEASEADALEAGGAGNGDSMLLEDIREPSASSYEGKNGADNESSEFYRTADPLVGMAQISKSKEHQEDVETVPGAPEAGNVDSQGETRCEGILENAEKSPRILEREDDFDRSEDLEKLCDMSLDGSCMIPLIPGEEDCSDEPRMPVPPMEGNCLTKILTDTLPITDLDVLESSEVDKLDKPEDDMWVEVRYMDKDLEGNSPEKTASEARKSRKSSKNSKSKHEKSSPKAAKNQADKVDEAATGKTSENAELAAEERISSPPVRRDALENNQKDKTILESVANEAKNDEPRKSGKRRISREEKQVEIGRDFGDEKDAKSTITTSILTKRRDSNVEIQVSNLNLKIHDKEVTRSETTAGKAKSQESSGDSVDAIEIKINLSRDVLSRRTSKFLEDDRRAALETLETRETSPQPRENVACGSGKKCCRRRRRSMPDGFESAKRARKSEEDHRCPPHYTAKKIKARNRRKLRKSMDDELLMSQERQRKESQLLDDRNFHLEMAKTFNLPWPREKTPEIGDSGSSNVAKEEETRNSKKSTSIKSRNDQRGEKHAKDTRSVSPAYNSSMDNSSTLDFDNFDVAPHNSSDTDPELSVREDSNDGKYGKARARLEDRERYRNPTNYGSSFDELASFDAFEINLNTVPIYTTKDGRITYSPNRNYTYRALIMEARQREGYPPIRKLHYPRHLTRIHHQKESSSRKMYKKRYEDERTEKKRRGVSDYHATKAKRAPTTRSHADETEARGSRLKKYEGRRKDPRIPGDSEFRSDDDDDDSRGYSGDVAAPKSRSSDAPAVFFKPEALKSLPDLELPASSVGFTTLPARRTEISRIDDPVEAAKHSNVMKNVEPMTSPRRFGAREAEDSIVAAIFQGQEFEISARKVEEDCAERLQSGRENCQRNSRFFRDSHSVGFTTLDSRVSMKTPMASPLVNLEKRPVGWDIEQDFQTVLSDSGLESSTTYVEASKESRRIQRWNNSFVDKVPSRPIFANIRDNEYEAAVDLSHEKTQENTSRYFDDEPKKTLRVREEEKAEIPVETMAIKTAANDDPFETNVKEISSVAEPDKTKNIDADNQKIVFSVPKISLDTENALGSSEMSEIVKSLDLAIANCNPGITKDARGRLKHEKLASIEETRGAPIFRRDRDAGKITEVPLRRASSDDVDSRESRRSLFFPDSRLPEIEETRMTEIRGERAKFPEDEEEARNVEETENQETRMTTSEAADRVATPETFGAPCKDFLIDTSTSFSSCLKLRVPEPISDLPTESETSRLEDDTSTRFASVSMDFKDLPEAAGSSQGNFSFSDREIRIEEANGRDFSFSNITESAMTASDESSRKGEESPGDSRTKGSLSREKDSMERAPILSFSGQIHDSRHDDSPSKSPPCLVSENSMPKLGIKGIESPKSTPQHPLEISRDFVENNSKKRSEYEREFGEENNSKKRIEYDREFGEENSGKKRIEFDREFEEENSSEKRIEFGEKNSSKKTIEFDREFEEENSSKKRIEYDRDFRGENSSKKRIEFDREFQEKNSSKKRIEFDREFQEKNSSKKRIEFDREFQEENNSKKRIEFDREFVEENSSKKTLEFNREFEEQNSSKKTLEYNREFLEENSSKKTFEYDREFLEENSSKKTLEYNREFLEENSSKKTFEYDREFLEQNSSKKMLEYNREFLEENSSKKTFEYDREFLEQNSSKKTLEYNREFLEENNSKKPLEYNREFLEQNSSKKTLECDREFLEENSSKKTLEYDREFLEENNSSKKPPDYDHEISSHPKIPKMIIRNVRSRPPTPTAVVEEADERVNSSKEQKLFEVEIKLEARGENREECKVPKMKIKLEDKQLSTMILGSSKSLESGAETAKIFPKVKIRKVRRSSTSRSPIRAEKFPLVGKLSRQSSETEMHMDFTENADNSNASGSYKFTLIEKSSAKSHNPSGRVERLEDDAKQDRIPKLTIKKNTEISGSGYSSSSSSKKRRSRSPGDSSSRKRKGTSRHSGSKKDDSRSQERRTNSLDNEGTTDSQSPSEKIPKVIIKRTSPSAEFKCELSKVGREAITKDSKWQPEVKLQRSWVLDCMAKEPGSGKFALKMLEHSLDSNEIPRKSREWKRSVSDCDLDKAITKTSNNRRRSLDESSVYDRRIRDKETREENPEIPSKPRKLSSSTGRVEKHETSDRRKSESEIPKKLDNIEASKNANSLEAPKNPIVVETTKTSSVKETAKPEEPLREKSSSTEISKKNNSPSKEKSARNDDDNESSVIKLDSSDESQTTIEILPASPDNSQPDLESFQPAESEIGCGAMEKLYSDDAIPTQFELELEIVDNSTVDSLDVPMPMPSYTSLEDDSTSTSVGFTTLTSTLENLQRPERFKPCSVNADDESHATDLGCEKFVYSDESIDPPAKIPANPASREVEKSARTISSSDSLVKEVLAAKETLKRCLTKSRSGATTTKPKSKPRPMTAAEKKQGSGFHFVGLAEFAKTSKNESQVFHGDGKSGVMRIKEESPALVSLEKPAKYGKSWSNERRLREDSVISGASGKSSRRPAAPATDVGGSRGGAKAAESENYGENSRAKCATATGEKIARHRSGGKSTEKSVGDSQRQSSGASTAVKIEDSSSSKIKSYKIPKISRSRDKSGKEEAAKEEKRKTPSPTVVMPVLEPQIELDFEIAGSDRDTSRSPPVITKQEEHDIRNEVPKKLEDNVNSDKLDSITIQDPEAVTFADIVSQLAYHEKATIRHRRYCTLCERWFPTAARHRRHLTGYQHRHTELTQRRTVHALFMLFTGKPCPRLLPASIVRTDCLPGEPTPLQIAVQDVAISLEDGAHVKPKEVSEKDD